MGNVLPLLILVFLTSFAGPAGLLVLAAVLAFEYVRIRAPQLLALS